MVRTRRISRSQRSRGITMIETLIATVIVTVAMLGAVGIFMSVATLSANTAQASTAETIARRAIEEAKNLGFANLPEGSTTRYFDINGAGGATSTSPTDRFKVVTTVSSDVISGGVVDKTALRTVIVTVISTTDNKTLETTGTYFAWGGP
ncbi:type IV pilus modification PilV family protein [Fimbriimonas ginsengisoli]|nr:type II secretion system protein [Fimbriimonas ginsengisoli]